MRSPIWKKYIYRVKHFNFNIFILLLLAHFLIDLAKKNRVQNDYYEILLTNRFFAHILWTTVSWWLASLADLQR